MAMWGLTGPNEGREAEAKKLMRRVATVAVRNAEPLAAYYQERLQKLGWDQPATDDEIAEYARIRRAYDEQYDDLYS
eukprot:gene44506-34713_t